MCSVILFTSVFVNICLAQQIMVVPLSLEATNSTYATSPLADGVTFVSDGDSEYDFLVVLDGDLDGASHLTIGADGALLLPGDESVFSLSSPIVRLRDGDYCVSFVAIPSQDKGTEAESAAQQQWESLNGAWFARAFGWGWQESLGEWLAENVLIPVVGVENLAGASDTTLVTGTVIVSVPIAIVIVAGGEVVLGVGTLGGGATTTATTTAAVEAEATRRYINLIGNAVRKGKDLTRKDPTDFDF